MTETMIELPNQRKKGSSKKSRSNCSVVQGFGQKMSDTLADLQIALEGRDQDPVEREEDKDQQDAPGRYRGRSWPTVSGASGSGACVPWEDRTPGPPDQLEGQGNDGEEQVDQHADTVNDPILPGHTVILRHHCA